MPYISEAAQAKGMRRMFAQVASNYDRINRAISLGQDQAWRQFACRLAQPKAGGLILDIATGTADMATILAQRGTRVVGLDLCSDMLELGRAKVQKAGLEARTTFLLGDALNLPFPDDTFDAAITSFALRNMGKLSLLFAEVRRVLRPGGRLVSLELAPPQQGLTSMAHRFYLSRVVPVIGSWLGGPKGAYAYLPRSIINFHTPEAIKGIMVGVGLRQVAGYRLGLGAAMVHVALKQPS